MGRCAGQSNSRAGDTRMIIGRRRKTSGHLWLDHLKRGSGLFMQKAAHAQTYQSQAVVLGLRTTADYGGTWECRSLQAKSPATIELMVNLTELDDEEQFTLAVCTNFVF